LSLEIFKAEHCKDLASYEGKGPAFTLFHGEEIVASGGFYVLWPGVCEAWLKVTPLVYKYPLSFCKEVKKVFDKMKMVRIQASVKVSDKRAVKFLKHLGFKIEGFMEKYGPDGSDHYMMGRVK
jgi:hypothetical protein